MLITEKPGPIWLVTQQGEKIRVSHTPAVYFEGQNGMHGVFLSPHYTTDHSIYLTYAEPGEYGGGLVLARAKLKVPHRRRRSRRSRMSRPCRTLALCQNSDDPNFMKRQWLILGGRHGSFGHAHIQTSYLIENN